MVEDTICRENGNPIDLKYDEKKYSIEYVKNKNMIILRRLLDNQVVEIFSDKIGFIVQCNIEGETNFLVTDYSEVGKDGRPLLKFNHYVDRNCLDSLQLKASFDCELLSLSDCRITDSSYLVEQDGYTSCIYNLKQKSRRFERVYNDSEVKEMFNDNTLLVLEKVHADYNWDVNDTLTYGMNPETFEITTPIWSELQQRYINIYDQEELDREGVFLSNMENLRRRAFYFEVKRYLDEIARQLDTPKKIFIHGEINEEFVRSFTNIGKGRK